MIQAVFLDIDGTLVSVRTHKPAPGTAEALLAAKEKGIKLFVATGRHTAVREEGYILDLLPDCFDGFVAMTGQYCYTRGGETVLKAPLDSEDVRTIMEVADRYDIPYTFCYADKVYISCVNDLVLRHNASIGLPVPAVHRLDPQRDVYAITMYIDPVLEEAVLRPRLRHSATVSWMGGISDLYAVNGGKRAGIEAMLAHFGIPKENAMGIGDSDNDLSMLESVGIPVAMGNSTPRVKAMAEYITATCEEDGIYHAFLHYGIIGES